MSRKSQLRKRRDNRDNLQAKVRPETVQAAVRQELRAWSGPIPSPEDIERYELICPGSAQQILDMAADRQAHNQEIEKKEVAMQETFLARHQKYFGRGQIWAGCITILALACGTYIAATVSAKYGSIIIGSVMSVLVGAFVWGKWIDGSNTNGQKP